MAGLLRVPCKPMGNNDPLLKDSINLSCPAGTTPIPQFTVPTGRGNIRAIQIFVGSDTMADVDDSEITVTANGTSVLDGEGILPYTMFYANTNIPMLIDIPEAAIIAGQILNNSAVTWNVVIDFFFFDPYKQ